MQEQPAKTNPNTPWPNAPWGPREALYSIGALAAVTGASSGLFLLLLVLNSLVRGDQGDTPVWAVLIATLVLQVGMAATALILGPRRFGASVAVLFGPSHLSSLRLLSWGIGAMLLSLVATAVFVALASQLSDRLVPDPLPDELDLESLRLLSFVSIVLIAPVVEETFFRGLLFVGIARRWGAWRGAAASAAVFAATHVDVALLGPAFLSGLVFAGVYRRTGSLWAAILAHTAQNAIAFGVA